jgi:ribosomal protein S18 acetylase RimI-like enzyme
MNSLEVRRALSSDIPAAAELAGELVRMHNAQDPSRFFLPERVVEGYTQWLAREAKREGAVVLVACLDGALVGYAYGALEPRDWNLLLAEHGAIHDVYVKETSRTQGVGRRLMRDMIAELEARGAERIVLSTMVGNQRAQRLFSSLGFRPTLLEMTRDHQ